MYNIYFGDLDLIMHCTQLYEHIDGKRRGGNLNSVTYPYAVYRVVCTVANKLTYKIATMTTIILPAFFHCDAC